MVKYIKKMLASLKVVAYGGLAIMIYGNLIGPEGVAEILKVENPSKKGLDTVGGVLIPKYVLYWTFGTVILEVLDNIFSLFESEESKFKYLTREEFNNKQLDKRKQRIYELKEENKKINS
ncbi:hypothetical protein [Lysinibacillus sp. RC79]|uniref:hypothetical protein n=1 Tax=Lysinibacillus sp. RC79 TaxID=3156296 RepID=UPI0035136855